MKRISSRSPRQISNGCALLLALFLPGSAPACDLCAIYRAGDAQGGTGRGLFLSLSHQYTPYRTTQLNGQEIQLQNPSHVDSAITHAVLGYNFSSRIGLSASLPITRLQFKRTDLRYSLSAPPVLFTENGSSSGLGDLSLIGRVAVLQKVEMKRGLVVNLLAGVKLPSGDADRLREEVDQARIFNAFLPPGTPHDPLGHSVSSVHPHSLSLGSGSVDGIFGLTANGRWQRGFVNAQAQYSVRTHGESGFKFGNQLLISGGPGAFLLLTKSWTASLQANAVFDKQSRDVVLGKASDRTGSTAWYLGPLLNITWDSHLSANFGIDLPVKLRNNGLQSVPDYRLHGGISWRF